MKRGFSNLTSSTSKADFILKDGTSVVGVVRNPYERLVASYYESWGYESFGQFLKSNVFRSQSYIYYGLPVVSLNSWQEDLERIDFGSDEESVDLSSVEIYTDYKRYFNQELFEYVEPIVQPDIVKFGFTF